MNVNFEFLDLDTIENVISCMHYKFDKVVFFGEYDVVTKQKEATERFLNKYCNVDIVDFHTLSSHSIDSILENMEKIIQNELNQGNSLFFDLTGGEGIIPVVFGMLSQKFNLPIHLYDVKKNKLFEQNNYDSSISKSVTKQNVKFGIKEYIEMQGGVVNLNLKKGYKSIESCGIEPFINDIWNISAKYFDLWNPFSNFAKKIFNPDNNLSVSLHAHDVLNALKQNNNSLDTAVELNRIVDELAAIGALQDVVHSNGKYSFRYTNEAVKDCILDGGSILELKTYIEEKKKASESMVGVHIDWDGIIHEKSSDVVDVLNEVDVLSLNDNVLTFISCKSGKMLSGEAMEAMYELDAVAKRFGGKYAKKVLALVQQLRPSDIERAKEMNIKLQYF